jgi:hypothetical protein
MKTYGWDVRWPVGSRMEYEESNMKNRHLQALMVAIFLVVAVCAIPLQAAAADTEFRLVCQSYFRPDLTVPPGKVKQLELEIHIPRGPVPEIALPRDEVKAKHRDFVVVMSNDRGSVLLDIMDAKTNKHLQRFLWQFSEVPRNIFGGQGFTGLIYFNHPRTGSELQMICTARPLKKK